MQTEYEKPEREKPRQNKEVKEIARRKTEIESGQELAALLKAETSTDRIRIGYMKSP